MYKEYRIKAKAIRESRVFSPIEREKKLSNLMFNLYCKYHQED